MQWTDDQLKAITAKDGTLLVSAAAGSGKTAVLVERVISRLEDQENGCSVDELLIVTFTKAATAQMREKISEKLAKRVAENPGNDYLLRQQTLLPFAQISTIDSFCADIVRENFQKLGIEPDFQIADDNQMKLLQEECAAEIVEKYFSNLDERFIQLSELLFSGRDDHRLIETILELNTEASSYPNPEEWLHGLSDGYYASVSPDTSTWGLLAKSIAKSIVDTCVAVNQNALRIIENDDVIDKKYRPFLSGEIEALEMFRQVLFTEGWDVIREQMAVLTQRLSGRCPIIKGYESFYKDVAQAAHSDNKKKRLPKLQSLFCTTSKEYVEDAFYAEPLVRKVSEVVIAYRELLMAKKMEQNSYEFSDISMFALQCLQDEQGNKSEYAEELSRRYCEILVDEFQDVNQAQYKLFKLLSKDESNLFMVGDAKQSIYKFRQARPDIFIKMKSDYPLYEKDNYPAVVQLDNNFRSRSGVTDWVNFTFSQLMYSEDDDCYEVNYNQREYLRPAAVYPPSPTADAQLHILRKIGKEERIVAEGRYIARYILEQLQNGLMVTEDGFERRATFGDFCILLRSDAGNISKIASVLQEYDIPVQSGNKGGFFDAPEIMFMLSLVRVLDNPLQDVPLLSVLLSPVFGFTTDDLTALRLMDKDATLYALIHQAAKEDERYARFADQLSSLRMLAATVSAGELIRRLLEITGYASIAGAMIGGEGRQANLRLLQRMAESYERTGKMGLSGFVRYIDRMIEQQTKVERASAPLATANVVRIMTIHRSKGLEFPVCILANTVGKFNDDEYSNNYIYHSDYGMAIVRRDTEHFAQYETVSKNVLNAKVRESNINEEMRVLYVAMTRAKEKLVAVATYDKPENKIAAMLTRCNENGTIAGALEMNNYADMLLCSALRHPDAHSIRHSVSYSGDETTIQADFTLQTVLEDTPLPEGNEESLEVPDIVPDREIVAKIQERTDYQYPFAALASVTAKHAASEMETLGVNRTFFATSRPSFLNAGGLTPAQRGTVLHRFMQLADYHEAAQNVEKELLRLQKEGSFTEEEARVLPVDAVKQFFRSETGQRVLRAGDQVFREKKFAIEVRVQSLYPELPPELDETVVIQGMVDCAFVENGELIILDYKTDRESPQVLRERYNTQLSVYQQAMQQCTDYPVGGALLYSFYNHCTVEM